jgi:hypothetical protein
LSSPILTRKDCILITENITSVLRRIIIEYVIINERINWNLSKFRRAYIIGRPRILRKLSINENCVSVTSKSECEWKGFYGKRNGGSVIFCNTFLMIKTFTKF